MAAPFETHEVLNQSPPFEDIDLFACDRPLQDAAGIGDGHDNGRHHQPERAREVDAEHRHFPPASARSRDPSSAEA